MVEEVYYHEVCGMPFTEKYCSHCLWYNSIQRVDKETGHYIINCASKECTRGKGVYNTFLNAFIENATHDRVIRYEECSIR